MEPMMQDFSQLHHCARTTVVAFAAALFAQVSIAQSKPDPKVVAGIPALPIPSHQPTPEQIAKIFEWIRDFGADGCHPKICTGGGGVKPTIGPIPKPPGPLELNSLKPGDIRSFELGLAMLIKVSGANILNVQTNLNAMSSKAK
jgi:hypothetical protein